MKRVFLYFIQKTMTVKTSVIYRPFLWLEVKQDIDTMLYNANDMLSAYNKKNNTQKEIKEYFKLKSTEDYIEVLNREKNTQLELYLSKRGKYWWTRMCDKLLIDFMMRLSPEFKSKAIDFILEWFSLAGKRTAIKEWYKRLTSSIAEMDLSNFRERITMINVLVTGSPASGQRSRLEEAQMQKMDDLQTIAWWLIRAGMSMEEVKNVLIKSL